MYLRLFMPPVAHMGESSRRVRISHFIFWRIVQLQKQKDAPIPEASPGSLACKVFKNPYTGPRFEVSSERLISNFSWQAWESNPRCRDYKSRALTDQISKNM
jgi:hypothetical protein